MDAYERNTTITNTRETAAVGGITPHDGARTDARQDLDAAFAEVLARAAALPDLPVADYNSADELVDAQIKLVVEHSNVRVRFPEPGQAPRDRIFQPGLFGEPCMPVTLGGGRSHRMPVHSVFSCAARSDEPFMLLARTSEETYTVIFRIPADGAETAARARETANRMVRAIADDVGRRIAHPGQGVWQMSLALVAARNAARHSGGAHSDFEWWASTLTQQDFVRLLRLRLGERAESGRSAEPPRGNALSPVINPVPLTEYMIDIQPGRARSWRQAFAADYMIDVVPGHRTARCSPTTWVDHNCGPAAAQRAAATGSPPQRLGSWLGRMTGRTLGAFLRELLGRIDKVALKRRLPMPPAPAVSAREPAEAQTGYRVLLDRELAAC